MCCYSRRARQRFDPKTKARSTRLCGAATRILPFLDTRNTSGRYMSDGATGACHLPLRPIHPTANLGDPPFEPNIRARCADYGLPYPTARNKTSQASTLRSLRSLVLQNYSRSFISIARASVAMSRRTCWNSAFTSVSNRSIF